MSTTSGSIVWTSRLASTSSDSANAITVGTDGSVYIAGATQGNLGGQTNSGAEDGFIAKYNQDGTLVWTRLIGSSDQLVDGTYREAANGLVAGADGSIYLVGSVRGSIDGQTFNGGYTDVLLIKYDADGNKAWTRLFGSSGTEWGNAIAVSPDGSILIAGFAPGVGSLDGQSRNNDAFVAKYSPDGSRVWTRLLGPSAASALTVGSDGSVYVAGRATGSLGGQTGSGGTDAFISKLNSDGTVAWTRLSGTGDWVQANALAKGTDGSIYVAGLTRGGSLDGQSPISAAEDVFVSKYNPDGTKVWTKVLGASSGDQAYGLAAGSDGAIYLTGVANGNFDGQTAIGNNDIFVTKLQSDGTKTWSLQYGTGNHDQGNGIAVGSDGSVFVAGAIDGASDAFVSKITSVISSVSSSSSSTVVSTPICFTRGTHIQIGEQSKPVESLSISNQVSTNNASAAVKWIGYQRRTPEFAAFQDYLPVKISAGALDDNLPLRDLYLSPDHAVLVDGHLIHAKALVNGKTITQLTEWTGDIEYYHIETEAHEIIYAEGVPCETFIDNVSREQFDNYAEYQALYPNTRMMKELPLPRVKFKRQLPLVIKQRLESRITELDRQHKV